MRIAPIVLVTLAVAVSAAEVLDRIAVVVADEPILASEIQGTVQNYLAQIGARPSPDELDLLTKQVFAQLVANRVFVQEAERRGITITYAQLDSLVAKQFTQARSAYASEEEFTAAIAGVGLTVDKLEDLYRTQAREDYLISQLMQEYYSARINITEEDIDDYLALYESDEGSRVVYTLRHVTAYVRPGAATEGEVEALAARIAGLARRGGDFFALADTYSDVPADLGVVERGFLEEPLDRALFSLAPGEVSDPVRTKYGWHVAKVLERLDENHVRAAHIQLNVRPTSDDEARTYEALDAVRRLLERDPRADVSDTGYEDILEVEVRQTAQSVIETTNAPLGAELAGMAAGGVSSAYGVSGGLRVTQLVDRTERREMTREEAEAAIYSQRTQEKQTVWVTELIAKTYIDVKLPELRGILDAGPGQR
ncbi:MAG TPA: peptidylprolyl isomerase [bacterium]|nr:peptidylprolyl isomerase [bacterium]